MHTPQKPIEALLNELDCISNNLSLTVFNKFDCVIRTDSDSKTLQKLSIMINFVLESTRRSLYQLEKQALEQEALAKSQEKLNKELIESLDKKEAAEKKLESVYKALIKASRQAGMAEIASEILHNVGNVFNSFNVAFLNLKKLHTTFDPSKLNQVVQKISELKESDENPLKTMDAIGSYLGAYTEYMQDVKEQIEKETERLNGLSQHMQRIITAQQKIAKSMRVTERLNINEIVEDVLEISKTSFSGREVTIIKNLEKVPIILEDRHKISLVLTNIFSNAKAALQNASTKKIEIHTYADDDYVYVEVKDTGVGILKENLIKIFNHGFTTKADGHGFGLHSSSNICKEMGGDLLVHSEGLEKGSTFTVKLPLKPSKEELKKEAS